MVENIDLEMCHHGKDFGKGFYLTTSYDQAERFVKLSVKNAINIGTMDGVGNHGYVNTYKFYPSDDISEYDFHEADAMWLHFVAGNRDANLFAEMIKEFEKFDIVGGKIANDRTSATLSQYVNGIFGIPGEMDADDIAIRLLLPNRLENQYCFRSERAVSCLHFDGANEVSI